MLASGSSGNSALIATENTRLLVDAGLSVRELLRRLHAIGEDAARLDAIVVTHEHSDHVGGLARTAKKLKLPVYCTRLTAPALQWDGFEPALETFQAGARFQIGDIEVHSFTIPHDAVDPVGLCFRAEGIRIGIVTDLGYVTDSIRIHLRGTHALLLESNHDIEMLKIGPYPWAVKQRVMGRMGHLSNDGMSEFLLRDLDGETANLILGHLSEHNNHPAIVQMMGAQALERRGIPARLEIASQRTPTSVIQF